MLEDKNRLIFQEPDADELLKKIDFEKSNGLVPLITQDAETNEVLMIGYANREAVYLTLTSGYVHYWSRSRKKLWKKGETSGHLQLVQEIRVDCDEDALLIKVNQIGAACHENYRSCFFRKFNNSTIEITHKRIE